MKKILAGGLCALTLAACAADMGTTPSGALSPHYIENEVSRAMTNRDIHTVIHGYPFGGDRAEFDRIVTDSLERAPEIPLGADFTTAPDRSAMQDYRVVIAFNPDPTYPAWDMCKEDAVPAVAPAQTHVTVPPSILVHAAFCRNNTLVNSATGYVENATSPYDVRFQSMLTRVAGHLVPARHVSGQERQKL